MEWQRDYTTLTVELEGQSQTSNARFTIIPLFGNTDFIVRYIILLHSYSVKVHTCNGYLSFAEILV